MKIKSKLLAAPLSAAVALALAAGTVAPMASAAVVDSVIDHSRKASMSITKYDITEAQKAGVNTSVLVTNGKQNSTAENLLSDYTLGGVEFTYLQLGDIDMYTSGTASNPQLEVIYSVGNEQVRAALGLTSTNAVKTEGGVPWYTSDTLRDCLSSKLTSNRRATTDVLESIVNQAGTALPLTDDTTGTTSASKLDLGLYLVVETEVPENVTSTTNPFLVSLPMTEIQGNGWIYDVSVYPKNETGNPTLEKEVSDLAHGVSFTGDIHNKGYMDVATGSTGDVMGYRFISTLPTVSSTATYLTTYRFDDVLSKGLEYNKYNVKVCWYKNYADAVADYTLANLTAGATSGAKAVETWTCNATTGKGTYFDVTYGAAQADGSTSMAVVFNQAGLSRINTPAATGDQLGRYSNYTCVVYYTATINANADVVLGDKGNPNDVTLTWKRTSEEYFDTLEDEAKVYSYGIHLVKKFQGGSTNFSAVKFVAKNITNVTGQYYIVANKTADGVYYATGTTKDDTKATRMTPDSTGNLYIYGLEEDTYQLTEVQTAPGFTLLEDEITIDFNTKYKTGVKVGSLTASATVDGKAAAMEAQNGSVNAQVALTVVNHKGFELPQTGGTGTMLTTLGGVVAAGGLLTATAFTLAQRRRSSDDERKDG